MIPAWFTENAHKIVNKGILLPGESIVSAWTRIAVTANKHLKIPGFTNDLIEAFVKGYIGAATPILANLGTNKGLAISCNSIHIYDSLDSIGSHAKELIKLTQKGAGVGVYWGDIRPSGSPISSGGFHDGVTRFILLYDRIVDCIDQAGTRRGSAAHGLPIRHKDFRQMMLAKDHNMADPRGILDGNVFATVPDEFMEKLICGGEEEKELMNLCHKTRLESGSPYFVFIDNINNQNPPAYVNNNLEVSTTNICSEIVLFTDENHTFVCCLSSLNLAKWNEWNTWRSPNLGFTVPQLCTYLLDAVLSDYITKAKQISSMGRAIRSAEKGRAIGVGTMGLHDLFQQMMLPFGSKKAKDLSENIHKFIRQEADKASKELALRYGEPLWCEGTGFRNTHRLAIAPTKTNSKVTNAGSEGVEPYISNFYRLKEKVNATVKNRNLEKLAEEKGINNFEFWKSINEDLGSILFSPHFSFEEKMVFLTAREIDPMDIVENACRIQKHVDQAISTNLFASPYSSVRKLNEPVIYAWANNLKTLYYLKSLSSTVVKSLEGKAFIVTKKDCPYCTKAKEFLRRKDYSILEAKLEEIDKDYFHWDTVPRIWLDGYYIGTYQDMVDYFQVKESKKNQEIEQKEVEDCLNCHA